MFLNPETKNKRKGLKSFVSVYFGVCRNENKEENKIKFFASGLDEFMFCKEKFDSVIFKIRLSRVPPPVTKLKFI